MHAMTGEEKERTGSDVLPVSLHEGASTRSLLWAESAVA